MPCANTYVAVGASEEKQAVTQLFVAMAMLHSRFQSISKDPPIVHSGVQGGQNFVFFDGF